VVVLTFAVRAKGVANPAIGDRLITTWRVLIINILRIHARMFKLVKVLCNAQLIVILN